MKLISKRAKNIALLTAAGIMCVMQGTATAQVWPGNGKVTAEICLAPPSLTYPPLAPGKIPLPDTLQYFYVSLDYRGNALSTGEFSVKLKYPVFRFAEEAAQRYETWLLNQVFILGSNTEHEEIQQYKIAKDIPGYAQSCLDSWLSGEETRYMGCIQESLAVEVALNARIVTLSVTHGGFWGGAHGDDSVQHYMFDADFNPIDPYSVFEPSQVEHFKKLLISEYDRQVDSIRDYDEEYKLNPDSFALIPEGLVAHYYGWSFAEGKPEVSIDTSKFLNYLKPEYRDMYAQLNQPKVDEDEW